MVHSEHLKNINCNQNKFFQQVLHLAISLISLSSLKSLINKFRSCKSFLNKVNRLHLGLPTLPLNKWSVSTANIKAWWAAVFSSLLKMWPNILHLCLATLSESLSTLLILYKVLLLIWAGYLMFNILRKSLLCVTSSLFKAALVGDQLLELYMSTDTTCAS